MKRWKAATLAAVSVLMVWAGISFAQPSPMPPIKPIQLVTEVGSVSGTRDKIEVKIKAMISRGGTELSVIVTDESSMILSQHSVPRTSLAPLASLLERAAEGLYAGSTFREGIEGIEVSTVKAGHETLIKMEFKGGFLEGGHLQLDGENAETLGRILRKAERIAAWLAERIGALQPE